MNKDNCQTMRGMDLLFQVTGKHIHKLGEYA